MNKFPDKIRELRIAKHMSQSELGDVLGVSRAAVSEWEKGKSVPRLDKLAEMCRFFNVPMSQLSGTPVESISVDGALQQLPDDLQAVLRQSFLNTVEGFKAGKKP